MMTVNPDKKREQIQMFCMDDLVPNGSSNAYKDSFYSVSLWN